MHRILALLLTAAWLAGCDFVQEHRARGAEQQRIACRDKICEGDDVPRVDRRTETVLKLDGRYFAGPRSYFVSVNRGGTFFWPSKTPLAGPAGGGDFPERGQTHEASAVDIFLRSSSIPEPPVGYELIRMAEANGWIERRRQVRPGLELIWMKPGVGPNGRTLNHTTYHVATDLRGPDGLPPVGACTEHAKHGAGGGGFLWKPGIWAGFRMSNRHCGDWPEVYQEVIRVLGLLREV